MQQDMKKGSMLLKAQQQLTWLGYIFLFCQSPFFVLSLKVGISIMYIRFPMFFFFFFSNTSFSNTSLVLIYSLTQNSLITTEGFHSFQWVLDQIHAYLGCSVQCCQSTKGFVIQGKYRGASCFVYSGNSNVLRTVLWP